MKVLKQLFAGQLPELVMFDLDGTLLDSIPDLAAATDRMLVQLGREPAGIDKIRGWVGNGAQILVRRALSGELHDHADVDEALVEQAAELFMQAYAQNNSRTVRYPGALECLKALREQGVKLGLVTNKPSQFIPELLEEHDLSGFFTWIVGGDTFAEKKPHPMGLEHVMTQAGVSPAASLFVGDSKNDIQAAHAAGVPSVALTYGYNYGEPIALQRPTQVLDCLSELVAP